MRRPFSVALFGLPGAFLHFGILPVRVLLARPISFDRSFVRALLVRSSCSSFFKNALLLPLSRAKQVTKPQNRKNWNKSVKTEQIPVIQIGSKQYARFALASKAPDMRRFTFRLFFAKSVTIFDFLAKYEPPQVWAGEPSQVWTGTRRKFGLANRPKQAEIIARRRADDV